MEKKTRFEYPYPGTTYGIYKFESGTSAKKDNLSFHLRSTDYFNFLEIQKHLTTNKKNYEKKFNACKPFPEISHSISPTALLIVEDGEKEFAVFAERSSSDRIHTGVELIGLPICPTPRREPEENIKNLFKEKEADEELLVDDKMEKKAKTMDGAFFINVLKRGAKEELGIELRDDKIKILAFGLDTERYLFNIIAIARKKMSILEIEPKKHLTFHGKRQYLNLPYIDFTPRAICKYLLKIQSKHQCPTTHMAAYYALCHCFELGDVYEAFLTLK